MSSFSRSFNFAGTIVSRNMHYSYGLVGRFSLQVKW
jgi:hypothetical protein